VQFDCSALRVLRAERRLSQADVASLSGIERRRYGLIERGIQPHDVAEAAAIAEALGVTVNELWRSPAGAARG
jgi:transcriptional regulator with XRE-family HTH domain